MLEKLKLQLFAASEDEEEADLDNGGQDDEDDEDDAIDNEDAESTEEEDPDVDDTDDTEEVDEESDDAEEEDQEEKPFMVFKSKDEHQKYMDTVIGKRLGEQRELSKKIEQQENLLGIFQQYYGVTDIAGLEKKADELLDDIAYKKGTTKDELIKQQQMQAELKQYKTMQEVLKKQAFENALKADCSKLAKANPDLYSDIDSDELMQNRSFIGMLANGVPFKQAYDALNVDKLLEKQTSKAKKKVIDDVKAKGTRITENATKKSKAASMKIDVSKLSDKQLEELTERARNGERIVF